MKRILLTTTAVFALAGMAHAQAVTATSGSADATNNTDSASAQVTNESSVALLEWGNSGNTISKAEVGDSIVAHAEGDDYNGLSGSATVPLSYGNVNNASAMLQIGTDNSVVNMQVGNYQESAFLQIGKDNEALISQTNFANEAAIAQVGENNHSDLIQNGDDNAATAAAWGDNNIALGLQSGGPQNILAITQEHDGNRSWVMQNGDTNTAATVQDGDGNLAFVSQGGLTSFSMTDIAGGSHGMTLPPSIITLSAGAGGLGASGNSAASLQVSDGNGVAIVQAGTGNTAVNYQN